MKVVKISFDILNSYHTSTKSLDQRKFNNFYQIGTKIHSLCHYFNSLMLYIKVSKDDFTIKPKLSELI
jgi:hypothetical protein